MKKIAYLITDHGIDGRDRETITFASFSEEERQEAFDSNKSVQAWRTLEERIVDVDAARKQALAKLNGIDRLVLGL